MTTLALLACNMRSVVAHNQVTSRYIVDKSPVAAIAEP